ncbi:SpdD-like protein [Streptomyces sp. NBC_00859]|uniref:SpdD-like protein n=1 Tax=Streptomyces sp. NBC_00859 TaxID=2903682 RepID=UPI003866A881|nr:SpdD-like protein [Streptomyces sp. NBC_00859]
MFRPKVPTNPMPTGVVAASVTAEQSAVVHHAPAPAPMGPAPARPTVQLTPGAVVALVGGGTAVVLVVGAVLVSMLLAVAVTAASLAVCALVIRSLMASQNRR